MDLPVTLLDDDSQLTTFENLRGGRAMVLDFWHTKCVKCPAALDRLNESAAGGGLVNGESVVFVACALSQGEGNRALACEMMSGHYENLTHVFMEIDAKEKAKEVFGFSAVPFVVVVRSDGTVLGQGDPKTINYVELLKSHGEHHVPTASQPTASHSLVFDEDF